MAFVMTEINLERIVLRELSQTEKDKLNVKSKSNENKTKPPNRNTKLVGTETRRGGW